MSRLLPSEPHRRRSLLSLGFVLLLAAVVSAAGCGDVTCPEGTSEDQGVCRPVGNTQVQPPDDTPRDAPREPEPPSPVERCDGLDNDGDEAIDEDWPALGEPCGEGGRVGECTPGTFVCAEDELGIVCEGAVEPAEEVCDLKDNDCNGLVDEGVLSIKREALPERASVVGIEGGFVVSRMAAGMLRVETYDSEGSRTGYYNDILNPSVDSRFVTSAAAGGRVLVAFGRLRFYVVEAHVGSDMVPVIVGVQTLNGEWDQGIDWGIYEPPHHPRVSATPPRFVGHRDLVTFALTPFSSNSLVDLTRAPTVARGLPYLAYFNTAGAFVAWEQADNVRAGWLLDDGELLLSIDVGRGAKPAIALGEEGPGVAYLDEGGLVITELGGGTLQCIEGRHCNAPVSEVVVEETVTTAMGLAFDDARDAWVVGASERVVWLGRNAAGPIVMQQAELLLGEEAPRRIDVATSGGTAAIVQSAKNGVTALTFMGCF